MTDLSWQTAAQKLIQLALLEDLADQGDVTTTALIPEGQTAQVQIVARQPGVLAGLPVGEMVFQKVDPSVRFQSLADDGTRLSAGQVVAELSGCLRSLLIGERTCLNFLTHLSGVATLTRRFVDAIAGTRAGIYDTRKTLPGWRVLEKQAVVAGGGKNHRMGLFDMVLIKDNHLAGWQTGTGQSLAEAVRAARQKSPAGLRIEIEVDTLEQLKDALQGLPEIVLLDNMSLEELRQAVAWRDQHAPQVELEASGGVSLATVADIARTGVERISVGALTHSPPALDLAFDWKLNQR
ncbi:MAG: carboxylating nicotinate-nucleotide diphosphorylase [Planctomycetes bacterium]|nr:carboxylating nicotinate-nucleotide diphosphorylase [Planctomycetota bacterium]